jgi:hypothetical protein
MATIFSETLVRLRKEAGFPTAYRFYHDNGGKPGLNITYRKYLAIEQGTILPVFGRLSFFIAALRRAPIEPEGKELITAWLKSTVGEKDYSALISPLLSPLSKVPVETPIRAAMKKTLARQKRYITPAQLKAITANRDNYLCFLSLSNDSDAWQPEELARTLGLPAARIKTALEELKQAKLLRKAGSRYRCHLMDDMLEYPSVTDATRNAIATLSDYQEELVAAGTRVWRQRGVLRADSEALSGFFPLMELNLSIAHTYATNERTKKTGLYFVEGRIVKLKDF